MKNKWHAEHNETLGVTLIGVGISTLITISDDGILTVWHDPDIAKRCGVVEIRTALRDQNVGDGRGNIVGNPSRKIVWRR